MTFIEQLMRYGQRFQAEKNNAQQSLFGGGGAALTSSAPCCPHAPIGAQLETLAKEREMIGHYLSAHPLDDYKIIINHMCKTQLTELENLEALKGQEIAVAGMVDQRAEPHHQDRQAVGQIRAGGLQRHA